MGTKDIRLRINNKTGVLSGNRETERVPAGLIRGGRDGRGIWRQVGGIVLWRHRFLRGRRALDGGRHLMDGVELVSAERVDQGPLSCGIARVFAVLRR